MSFLAPPTTAGHPPRPSHHPSPEPYVLSTPLPLSKPTSEPLAILPRSHLATYLYAAESHIPSLPYISENGSHSDIRSDGGVWNTGDCLLLLVGHRGYLATSKKIENNSHGRPVDAWEGSWKDIPHHDRRSAIYKYSFVASAINGYSFTRNSSGFPRANRVVPMLDFTNYHLLPLSSRLALYK